MLIPRAIRLSIILISGGIKDSWNTTIMMIKDMNNRAESVVFMR